MLRLRITIKTALAAAICAVAPSAADATDVFWVGNSAGSWNTPANWEDETGFNAVPFGNSPFFDQAYIGNGSSISLTVGAQNNIDALFIGGQSSRDDGINPIVFGEGGLTIGTGGSLNVTDAGGSATSGSVFVGRVPSFGAPDGTTSTDAQAGTLAITGSGSLDLANRLFLERRNNVNPMLTLQDSASLTVGGDTDIRGTARIVGPNVSFSTDTLQFGGLLRLIPEITAATHSPINVTGAATLNAGATIAPEISGVLSGGEQYTLVDAATIVDNGVVLDDSQIPLGAGQRARLFVDSSGATEQYKLGIDNVLTLTANRRTGELTIGNTHASGIEIKGYSIQSPSGKLVVGDWQSLDAASADGNTWSEANPTANALNELNLTSSRTIAGGSSDNFGTPYNLSELAEGDDLSFTYQTASGDTLTGLIEYTGGFNSLVLRVDPATGNAVLTNESQYTADINGYSITSGDGTAASGSLLTTFDSLQDQGVTDWSEANTSSEALNELSLENSIEFTTGKSVALDGLWNTGGNQDLALEFALLGGVGTLDGIVLYETILDGDYNYDGSVDAVDYTIWRDGLSPDSSIAGYLAWKNNFGATSGAGAGSITTTATPEPSALLVFASLLASASLAARRR